MILSKSRKQNQIGSLKLVITKPLTMIVSFGSCQYALVVMRELNQVNSVPLAVVSVDLLAALQIVQAHTEVFAAGDQVLAIVTDVN